MAQTKAHMEATNRFNKKAYDNLQLRIRKDSTLTANYIRAHAIGRGETVNSFLLRAVEEAIKRDNAEAVEDKADKEE